MATLQTNRHKLGLCEYELDVFRENNVASKDGMSIIYSIKRGKLLLQYWSDHQIENNPIETNDDKLYFVEKY